MIHELPARALFRFELPIQYLAKVPPVSGDVARWEPRYAAPDLCRIDGDEPYARVYWAWNEDCFFAAFDVRAAGHAPQCDTQHWWKGDGVRLCIDTRDARDLRRATRYCHFFYALPASGGPRKRDPIVGLHRMSRAKEPPPPVDVNRIKIGVRADRHGYGLELAIPAACLHGWDPVEHARIGVFYKIKDIRRGSQNLSITDDLGWNMDPSTWATGVLMH